MNNYRGSFRKISVLLCLFIATQNISFASSSKDELKDIQSHWSKTYVERLYKEGYVVGSNGYFQPNQALKTEDFLIMVLKVVDPSSKSLKAGDGEAYFKPFIDRALEIGLIKGQYDEVPQYVERSMPRELAVQVIDRALTMRGESPVADQGLEYKFKDYKIINDINKEAVLKAYQLGIIKGSNGNFEPKNPLTRAEAAVLVSKLMDKSMRDKLIFGTNPKTYDKAAEWYLSKFDTQVEKRTVVIEKKADGSINDGDVDYKETRKWWTDQEFEDRVLSNMCSHTPNQFVNSLQGQFEPSDSNMSTYGGFYVHDGEIGFVNKGGYKDTTAYKFYENNEIKNFNRLAYDLAKYFTQYASEHGRYADINFADDYLIMSYQASPYQGSELFYITLRTNGKTSKDVLYTNFEPHLTFANNIATTDTGIRWSEIDPLLKQIVYRTMGTQKSEKSYQFIRSILMYKDESETKVFYKKIDGVWYKANDMKETRPFVYSALY